MICSARYGLEMSGRRRVHVQIPPRVPIERGGLGFQREPRVKPGLFRFQKSSQLLSFLFSNSSSVTFSKSIGATGIFLVRCL